MDVDGFDFRDLQILLNYVASIGFPKDEYKMFSGWPRKDVSGWRGEVGEK